MYVCMQIISTCCKVRSTYLIHRLLYNSTVVLLCFPHEYRFEPTESGRPPSLSNLDIVSFQYHCGLV